MLKCTHCQEIFEYEGGGTIPCPCCDSADTVSLPEPPPTSVTVRFTGPGSAVFGLDVEGQITPGQLAAAGQYLSLRALLNWTMPNVLNAVAEAVVQRLLPSPDEPQIAVPGLTPAGVRQFLKGIRDD